MSMKKNADGDGGDGIISGNTAEMGGGILAYCGSLSIESGTVSGNKATNGNGGGVYGLKIL